MRSGRQRAEVVADERGRGSGTRSSPDAGSSRVTPDSTRANGQPSASASAPSVDGRSPTMMPRRAEALAHERRRSAPPVSPRPRARGPTQWRPPRRSHPHPGASRPGSDRSRRGWSRRSRRPRAPRGEDRSSSSKSKARWNPTTTAAAGGASTTSTRVGRAPRPHLARRRQAPARRAPASTASSAAAASALVSTSSSAAGIPTARASRRPRRRVDAELFDTKPTLNPAARRRAIASAAPGIGSSPRQTTPSRSQHTTGAFGSPDGSKLLAGLGERGAVLVERAHRDRELQVAARAGAVADAQEAQARARSGRSR